MTDSLMLWQLGCHNGKTLERERVISLIKNKICFDNLNDKPCEHSICYGLRDILTLINSGKSNNV